MNDRMLLVRSERGSSAESLQLCLTPKISSVPTDGLEIERLPVSALTLRHRLREHGLLASIDAGRQMLLVRRTLDTRGRPKTSAPSESQ
jgi:hypothetical protein